MASSSDEGDFNSQSHFAISTEDSGDDDTSSSSEEEPTPKKMKTEWVNSYSTQALNIMKKMGFEGKGLGKAGQGRLEPVEASKQEGRRGLGLKKTDLDAGIIPWDPEMEGITIPERMDWLINKSNDLDMILTDDLESWVKIGKQKLTIDDETLFCDPEILNGVLTSKTVFDEIEPHEMHRARSRSNPFETIKSAIFLNRAAVKMANMDSLCNFMFTKPVDEHGRSLVRENDLLYFADICAGPGGFSEYVLFRKKWSAKGFGFTLKGDNDFKLSEFLAGPAETFDPYYGINENGDIFDPDNQKSFADYVMKQTETGVHFVMADGGFSVKGKENIQEILSKQLYLCQCIVALSILRIKGHFVVKLFDIFTPFSVGLIFLMYKCFEEICICKPNTSRPANSERYLICKWKKPNTDRIERHLFEVNKAMWDNKCEDIDTNELVPYEVISQDQTFLQYIIDSNNRIGRNQIEGLIKIAAFCKMKDLKETRQIEFRQKCLALWNVPDGIRKNESEEVTLSEILQDWNDDKTFLSHPPLVLTSTEQLKRCFISIYDWYFIPFSRYETEKNIPTFFLCKAKNNVQRYAGGKWQPVEINIEISPKTLIYGEIVTEYIGEGRSQNKEHALHIIDGIMLGGEDIRRLPLKDRLKLCEKFARALNKPFKMGTAPIRCKKLHKLTDFTHFFQMRHYKLKEGVERLGCRIRTDEEKERFFTPGGLLFFNGIRDPFITCLSKKFKAYYYFDRANNKSFYSAERPPVEVFTSFRNSFYRRLEWKWTNILQVEENLRETQKESGILYRVDFHNFIESIICR